jgi:adrenodoxin-NADP+ reductase
MTDISAHALAALKESSVEEVVIIGRRGHIQASFTIKEIRELTKLDDVSVHISQAELDSSMTEVSKLELENSRPKHRIVELINKIASDTTARGSVDTNSKKVTFRFLLTPERISGTNENETDVASLTLAKNKLTVEGSKQKATATEEKETIECELILKSVGYKSESMAGVPFDTIKNIIPNHKGRVIIPSSEEKGFEQLDDNLYVCGWLKRGPSGIIGTNITDAKETVESILEGVALKKDFVKGDPLLNIPALSSPSVICWEDYLRIEGEEERRGTSSIPPKPREKICDIAELLGVAKSNI